MVHSKKYMDKCHTYSGCHTASRKFNRNKEWQLDPVVFSDIVKQFGSPCIDLFASRINKQMMPFVSWRPDPDACAVDAFSLSGIVINLCIYFLLSVCWGKCYRRSKQTESQRY